jgi:hypothetical protein
LIEEHASARAAFVQGYAGSRQRAVTEEHG